MIQPFKLNKMEADSALWKKLRAHIQERLDVARRQNDQSMTQDETERLRGKIATYKEMLAMEASE